MDFQILAILIALLLLVVLLGRNQKIKQQRAEINKLKKSLDEMDEQAKLVLRTDLELNKTQEELDKKIAGLYALQRLARALSTTLEESRIFNRITPEHLEDLGFERAFACLWSAKENRFLVHLGVSYAPQELKNIEDEINLNKKFYLDFIVQEKTFSSLSSGEAAIKNKISPIFKSCTFILSPILPKEGNRGFLLVGTEDPEVSLTEGDEELVTILANELGQALENARLFEKTWQAQQELEKKVEERTRELSAALEEVKKASKRKSDFVSSVSHELRTPLTSIKGYASILLGGKLGHLPGEISQRLEKINKHSDELAQFVNDLLDISRIESGKVAMQQETEDLKEIAEQAIDLLAMQLKEKRLDISLHIPKETQLVYVDAKQIQRVFINLISNALKFTSAGGKISISSHKLERAVQVEVSDTGYGIPLEAQDKLFEEFYRVDNPINEQIKGSGLGLALVKGVIEAHAGKIWVKSKPGQGSTFSFTLPQPPSERLTR